MTVEMRERNPIVCLRFLTPMRNSKTTASMSDSIPIANPRMWGRGPLNSIDSHVMIVDSRTMEEIRKRATLRVAMHTSANGAGPLSLPARPMMPACKDETVWRLAVSTDGVCKRGWGCALSSKIWRGKVIVLYLKTHRVYLHEAAESICRSEYLLSPLDASVNG